MALAREVSHPAFGPLDGFLRLRYGIGAPSVGRKPCFDGDLPCNHRPAGALSVATQAVGVRHRLGRFVPAALVAVQAGELDDRIARSVVELIGPEGAKVRPDRSRLALGSVEVPASSSV